MYVYRLIHKCIKMTIYCSFSKPIHVTYTNNTNL